MDPVGLVGRERPVGADEGVLRGLLGSAAVAEEAQRDREEPVLVGDDESLEARVEVAGEIRRQAAVGVHHPVEHAARRNRCMPQRYPATLHPTPARMAQSPDDAPR